MKYKVIYTWLLTLFSFHVFALDEFEQAKYISNLCQKLYFSEGSSKVQAFCVFYVNKPQSPCIESFPKTVTQPITSKPSCISRSVYDHKLQILVSGGDLQSYSTAVIANHLKYAALWDMAYFYADARTFRQQNGFLKPHWLKVQLLKDMLSDPSVGEDSWIAWIDDDLVLSDNNRHGMSMLDAYIHHYGSASSVIITTDTYPWPGDYDGKFNTGVVLVKKDNISRELFSKWWEKRPVSAEDQEQYIPPNQFGLKLVLQEHDYVSEGHLKIAPQRTDWGNLNTFHLFDLWDYNSDNGLAQFGDEAVQHPGIGGERKHELINQSLEAVSELSNLLPSSVKISACCHPHKMTGFTLNQMNAFVKKCLHQ